MKKLKVSSGFNVAVNLLIILLLFNLDKPVDAARKRQTNDTGPGRPPSSGPYIRKYRQAPLCVDENNLIPEEKGLTRFTWIFDYYKHNTYVPVWDNGISPTGFTRKFELTRIKVDDLNSGYSDHLRNWVHIEVETAMDIEGIYVQAISAPWGIPMGEFVTSFDCKDCLQKTSELKNHTHIIPCGKRAALDYNHPNVFTVGGGPPLPGQTERFLFQHVHFNFRYTQYPGVDHNYVQFLVIIVRSFAGNLTRFETFFTQTFKLDVVENPSGAYSPFYNGWEASEISCHDSGSKLRTDFTAYSGADRKTKIRYSRTFDLCLINDTEKNLLWFTCPPGPMYLGNANVPINKAEWTDLRTKYEMKGDPDNDPKFHEDAQFCKDAGTFDWLIGMLEWPLPPTVVVESIENQTVFLNETIEGEEVGLDLLSCVDTGSQLECIDIQGTTRDCTDYHVNDCHQEHFDNYFNMSKYYKKMFGKNVDNGTYLLSEASCNSVSFTDQIDIVAYGWGNKYVLDLHGKLLVFTWTVAWNVILFNGRFMKEYTVIQRNSSYFGIGNWLWYHIIWCYVGSMTMFTGVYLLAHSHSTHRKQIGTNSIPHNNVHDLCNLHIGQAELHHCLSVERKIHNGLGVASILVFFCSFISGWGRPANRFLRLVLLCYHFGMAWFGKMIFYAIMILGYLSEHHIINEGTLLGVFATDIVSFGMCVIATVFNVAIDNKYKIVQRKCFPVPEGITTHDVPIRLQIFLHLMLPVHITAQIACFFYVSGLFLRPEHKLCTRTE